MRHPSDGRVQAGSFQISLGLQQLGIQQGGPGGATDGVMGEQSKLPIQHWARTKASHGSGHAAAEFHIETRLRSDAGADVTDGNFGSSREVLFLRNATEFFSCRENVS